MNEFLRSCTCILSDEAFDYRNVVTEILSRPAYISLMPSVIEDLWPLYILECTAAKRFISGFEHHHVCFIPIGAHDFWALPGFIDLVKRFYRDEDLGISDHLTYGAEIEEIILLNSESIPRILPIEELGMINVAYIRIKFSTSPSIHLFVIADTAAGCWENIFLKYNIGCDMFIDSHRGLGNYLRETKLYKMFTQNPSDPLLPKFYFKGKFIKAAPPEGFVLQYTVPESKANECISQIFIANWG